jgi:hypothetical protein
MLPVEPGHAPAMHCVFLQPTLPTSQTQRCRKAARFVIKQFKSVGFSFLKYLTQSRSPQIYFVQYKGPP